jgi:8-oxo-dGTP diphosphatase
VFKIGVSGVVRNARGDVLLVRTDRFGWELPGGSVERGEDLQAALRREVLEESSCTLDGDGTLSGLYFVGESATLIVVFRAMSSTLEPHANGDEDVRDAAWFAPEAAVAHVTHEREHRRLEDALRAGPSVVYRVDG